MSQFRQAIKSQMKARVALCGPTGAGKTWSALEWATVLAGGGKVALIDTERGSASFYAPHFRFDTLVWEPPYDPQKLTQTLKDAQGEGYAVIVVDSLSHFWEGEGGTLDIVDAAAQRSQSKNSFTAWKIGTPIQRHMVDTLISLDAHVIITMRSKMEYTLEQDEKGKSQPRKVGLAPVQRAGLEYELTIVGDLDLEHRLTISKSRCDVLADQVIQPGRAADAAKTFLVWLNDGEPRASDAQLDQIREALTAISDEALRASTREGLVSQFGRPSELRASDVEEALQLISAAGRINEPGIPVSAPKEPSGESGASTAASSTEGIAVAEDLSLYSDEPL